MSASERKIRLVKKSGRAEEKVSARGSTYDNISAVDDALALLADAQRQLNTVQERINRARAALLKT